MTLLLLLRNHGISVPVAPVVYDNPRPFAWTEAGETPDELDARLAFTTVLCRSNGAPVDILDDLNKRQIVQQLNLPASYTVTMRMDDANYAYAVFEASPRLKVYRVATPAELASDPSTINKLVFYGSLPSEGIDEDSETGFATLTFQEPSWVLNDRYVPTSVSFTSTDQGDILWSLINTENSKTNGDTWIRQGVTATGKLRDRTYEKGKEVSGLIQDMTQVDEGCDVSITPVDYWSIDGTRVMGTFNAYSERGTDQTAAIFIHAAALEEGVAGGLPSNCSGMRRTRAKTITSATSVGSIDTQTYANTTSTYGLLESFETFSDVSISQTLLDKSVGKVANGQNAPMVIEIKNPNREAPQPFIDFNLGDTVYATCRRGGMLFTALPVRVHGIDVTVSDTGDLATKLTVATFPETIVAPDAIAGAPPVSDPVVVGTERVLGPPFTLYPGAACTVTTLVAHGSDTCYDLQTSGAPTSGAISGITGLIVGKDYTLSTYARGTASALDGTGTTWQIVAGGNISSNDASHIWNATLGTRVAWQQVSVTFTASATTENYYVQTAGKTDTHDTYFTHPTIAPA